MQRIILLIGLMLPILSVQAEFHDPMQPPAFALKKMRLEKARKNGPVKSLLKRAAPRSSSLDFVLSSILTSSRRTTAIINGRVVKKGDVIKGAKVLRIAKNSVRLTRKGKVIVLRLDAGTAIRVKSKIKSHVEKTL